MMHSALKIGNRIAKVPIIQGGMGVGISLSGLASAVAEAGGIGVIAAAMIGMNEPDIYANPREANIRALRSEIRKARAKTKGILGVNIMVALTNFSDMVNVAIEEDVDIIFSGAGLPLDLPKYAQNGCKTSFVPIVSSGRAAQIICRKWLSKFDYLPDAFVVEGPMAGGHLGFKKEQLDNPAYKLDALVPQVLDAIKPFENAQKKEIPIIAAGGIYTGDDIFKFLQMGAAAVQMGTRFVATHECDANPGFKQEYIDAQEKDMVIINSPVGLPGRAVQNKFIDEVNRGNRKPFKCPYHCIATCNYEESPYCIAFALMSAKKGNLKHGFAFAGQNAYRVDKIISVNDLITSLMREYAYACSQYVAPLRQVA